MIDTADTPPSASAPRPAGRPDGAGGRSAAAGAGGRSPATGLGQSSRAGRPSPRAERPSLRTTIGRPAPRILAALRHTNGGLVILAICVGAVAGVGAIAFRWLIQTFTWLFSGHTDYSAAGHAANPNVPWLGRWFVLLAPVIAGLIYGPLVQRYAREARGHGVPEVMYAVARRGGRIAPQVAVVKALASALCIGGGGSVGREGPIVQIGSAFGSTLGTWLRADEDRVRTLVACGAAGGIAATFNAPLAGVFFAMELILRDFAARTFGMVVLSSVTASVIGRAAFGNSPFLQLPAFGVHSLWQYGLFALLGLLAGGIGVGFTKVLYLIEDACDAGWRRTRLPEWARPAVGGLLVGLVLLALPEMYGVGYPVLEHAVAGGYALVFLVTLMLGKMFATSLTIGIGGSGGVFAPSLFIGAMFGAAFGQIVHAAFPGAAGSAGAYAIVGMGAVFAAASRAPITAVVILFELTGEYSVILPLMAAVALATGISRFLHSETIYTAKLRRRGVDIDEPVSPLAALRVRDALRSCPATPVGGPLVENLPAGSGAGQAAHPAHAVTGDLPLDQALAALTEADLRALPVLDDERDHLVGWVDHRGILSALHQPAR